MRERAVPLLVSAFVVCMGVAWVGASPPGAPFDERAHYVKAIGVGHGQWYGDPFRVSAAERRAFARLAQRRTAGSVRPSALRWQGRTIRDFTVPGGLLRASFGCTTVSRALNGDCSEHGPALPRASSGSYVGTYQPFAYVPPGLAIRLAGSPEGGVLLGRGASMVVSCALLIAAVWLLWSAPLGALSLVGFAVAVTPMVMFCAATLSPSGPEVAGAVCFAAALIRLLARPERASGWAWAALGLSGAVLASARALGPAFAVLLVAAVAALARPRVAWSRWRAGGPWAWLALGAVGLAGAASLVWEFARQPRPEPSGSSLVDAIGPSISNLPTVARHAVGVFGSLDAPMPDVGYVAWVILVVALMAVALAAGDRYERIGLVVLVAGLVVVTVGMSMVYREIGPLQGRYVLPLLVLAPLWAGEVVARQGAALSGRARALLTRGLLGTAALVQLFGWWANGRRFAGGEGGPWDFPFDDGWAPTGGWAPWLIAALAGMAAYLTAAVLASREERAA